MKVSARKHYIPRLMINRVWPGEGQRIPPYKEVVMVKDYTGYSYAREVRE